MFSRWHGSYMFFCFLVFVAKILKHKTGVPCFLDGVMRTCFGILVVKIKTSNIRQAAPTVSYMFWYPCR